MNNHNGSLPLIVAVTGHRDIPQDQIANIRSLIKSELDKIEELASPMTQIALLTGLASGSDQLVMDEVLKRRNNRWLKIAVLPMPLNDYELDFEVSSEREEFHRLLSHCDYVKELDWEKDTLDDDIKNKRDQQYRNQCKYITHNSQLVLALWDGYESEAEGACGTSYVVQLCKNGIPAVSSELYIPEKTSIIHIPVNRTSKPYRQFKKTKSELDDIFNLTHKFNFFNEYKAHPIACSSNMIEKNFRSNLDNGTNFMAQAYLKADYISLDTQKWRRFLIFSIYGLILIAACFKSLYDSESDDTYAYSYLIFSVVASIVYVVGFFRPLRSLFSDMPIMLEDKYLECRVLAEALRVQIFWRLSGVKANVADFYLKRVKSEVGWIREASRNFNFIAELESDAIVDIECVKTKWLADQENYYIGKEYSQAKVVSGKYHKCKEDHRRYKSLIFLLLVAGLFSSALFMFKDSNYVINKLVAFSTTILIAAAFVKNYVSLAGFSSNASNYQKVGELFRIARKCIDKSSETEINRSLFLLGKYALNENTDWLIQRRSTPLEFIH